MSTVPTIAQRYQGGLVALSVSASGAPRALCGQIPRLIQVSAHPGCRRAIRALLPPGCAMIAFIQHPDTRAVARCSLVLCWHPAPGKSLGAHSRAACAEGPQYQALCHAGQLRGTCGLGHWSATSLLTCAAQVAAKASFRMHQVSQAVCLACLLRPVHGRRRTRRPCRTGHLACTRCRQHLFPRSPCHGVASFLRRVQVHMTAPTDTKIIDLTMASSDNDIIDLNICPMTISTASQARSPSPPDTGRIVRSPHARHEARVRKQSGTRMQTAIIVVGQLVEVMTSSSGLAIVRSVTSASMGCHADLHASFRKLV